jgi:hypothetical protein
VKEKSIRYIFWAMMAFFIISVGSMFILVPIVGRTTGDSPLRFSTFAAWPVFFGLGVALLVLTVKKKVKGTAKKFLLLTGASAVGLPVFAVLHNLVYALFIHFFGENFWGPGGDEPVLFTLATIVCPLGFLVGAAGTIVLNIKNKTSVPAVGVQGGESN